MEKSALGVSKRIKELVMLQHMSDLQFNTDSCFQRGSGGPILRNMQGQIAQASEQPDPVEDVPTHCSGVRLDDL